MRHQRVTYGESRLPDLSSLVLGNLMLSVLLAVLSAAVCAPRLRHVDLREISGQYTLALLWAVSRFGLTILPAKTEVDFSRLDCEVIACTCDWVCGDDDGGDSQGLGSFRASLRI